MPTLGRQVHLPWDDLDEHVCFGCAVSNKDGLRLMFYETDAGGLATTWTSDQRFQNYPGMIHGGVGVTLLDELLGQVVFRETKYLSVSVTAKVDWVRPMTLGDSLTGWARVTGIVNMMQVAEAYLFDSKGRVLMTMSGTYYTPTQKQFLKMTGMASVPKKAESWFVC